MAVDPNITVPVAVKGFTWGAAAGWSTFVAVISGIALAFRHIGPATTKIVELVFNRADRLRGEKRTDEVGLENRIEAVEKRAAIAERRLGFVMSACTTLLEAMESVDANHPSLKHARAQLKMAVAANTEVDPFEELLNQLGGVAAVRGKP